MAKSLLGAAATVVASWWSILTFIALLSGQAPSDLFAATGSVLLVVAAGALSGCVCVVLWIYIERTERRYGLMAEDVRGLVSSIGPVPMLLQPPPEAASLPSFQAPDVPDDFYVRWLAHFDRTHPKHTALMRRMMRVMQAHRQLPASPVEGGHGGRTLLQHSLLCGYLMHDLARNFKYEGARSKNTARLLLPLVDPNYQFNPEDPLCVLIGIAHDLGKIESYRYDGDGQIVGIREEHDLTGARMIARMEESWDLPDADRFAMMMSLAHYHHPHELPLSPDRRAIDDRTIALMELLIIADVQTSAIENTGFRMSSDEFAQRYTVIPPENTLDAGLLYEQFLEQMHRKHLLNSNDRNDCIAWLTSVSGSSRALFLVNEGNMAAAIGKALDIDPSITVEDGRRVLTITLLGELERRGLLIQKMKIESGEVVAYAPESALWLAMFNQRTVQGQRPLFGPVVVYVIDPSKLPDLHAVKPRAGNAVLTRGLFGENRRLGARKTALLDDGQTPPAPASSAQGLDDAAPVQISNVDRVEPAVPWHDAVAGAEAAPVVSTRSETSQMRRPHSPAQTGPQADSFGVDPTQASPKPGTGGARGKRSTDAKQSARPRPAQPAEPRAPAAEIPAGVSADATLSELPAGPSAPAVSAAPAPAPAPASAAPVAAPAAPAPKVLLVQEQPPVAPLPGDDPVRPTAHAVMSAVISTINKLGEGVAEYARVTPAGHTITLPCDVLATHAPEIAWLDARSHLLGLTARQEIPMAVRLSATSVFALEYTVPTN